MPASSLPAPLSPRLQTACFVAYLVFLWLLPHDYGMTLNGKILNWKLARMALVVVSGLPLLVLIARARPASHWRWGLLGSWVPLAFGLYVLTQFPSAAFEDWQRPLRMAAAGYHADPVRWYGAKRVLGAGGTALTYAWLIGSYASVAKRWWGALLIGATAFTLMLILDFAVLATVTGPHKLH